MSEAQTTIIKVPDDPGWSVLLYSKLRQYADRIERYGVQYRAPEAWGKANYAYALLKELLHAGQIDSFELARRWAAEGWLDVEAFNSRFSVIYAYTLDRDLLKRSVESYDRRHGIV